MKYSSIDSLDIFFIVGGDKCIKSRNVGEMNDLNNPYNPGTGAPPPELAGRDQVLNEIKLAIQRARIGKPPRNYMLLGLRGVGKTVLLQRILGDVASEKAMTEILKVTECYPFFLQVWGDFVWRVAESPPFLIEDVKNASISAIEHLDSGFFRVRYDRLTDTQQHYVQSMAKLGPKTVKSAEVAANLGITPSKAAPIRAQIVKKGMIYSPRRGEVAFTVPKFDEFILRIM